MDRLFRVVVLALVAFVGLLASLNISQDRRIRALEQRLAAPAPATVRAISGYPNGETREQYIERQVQQTLRDDVDYAEVMRRVERARRDRRTVP